ncbi:MAG: FtsX-like permease family protein [Anaerolineales bacterium]|nr:MAG: FtsX-like permease family protein [Anaerolineales bacterium]
MGVIRYKIWSDLWANKSRTLQVVLIIAMGAFAIGMIVTTRTLMVAGMSEIWSTVSPATITLWASPSVGDDTITALKRIEGLEDVEGYATATIEWRLSPEDEWSPAVLIARDDYKDQHYTTLGLISGKWPQENTMAVVQGADVVYDIREGGRLTLRVNDHDQEVKIGGVVYDPVASPPSYGGPAQFYTTRDRFGDLTGDRDYNRILAGIPTDVEYDEAASIAIADQMKRKLEKQGSDSGGASPPDGQRVTDPQKHFFQDTMDAVFLILGVMSILALFLALFLVYNTINAIVSQQVDQIGIMKAIGAGTGRILWTYLINIFAYSFLALLIAIPLAAIGGWGLNLFLMGTFNADPGSFTVVREAVLAMVAIALLAPLLTSMIPILSGVRITVREAVSTYGLSVGAGLLERLLARMERIPRLVLLTISNTFRNKGRVFLTQITLVLSGLVFMMVMSTGDSVRNTFGDLIFSILRYNVSFVFEDPERIHQVEALALAHPEVKAVEVWNVGGGQIRPAGQPESDDDEGVLVFGVPLPTNLYGPQLRAGRWLQPGDTYAVVLNQTLADEVGVGPGDWVTVDHGVEGETDWQVVGLLFDPVITNSAHVSRQTVVKELNQVGKGNSVWIQTVRGDPDSEVAAAGHLRQYFDEHQFDLEPGGIFAGQDTASEATAAIVANFAMISTLLGVMAIVIGAVGGVALSGVLSLNVLERTREIGVMRAIGASSGAIARLFIGEGLILGWLSWAIAVPLSIPAGRLMTQAVGVPFNMSLVYTYSPSGAIYWLFIVTLLSILASYFPARGATRISVRESLAYA